MAQTKGVPLALYPDCETITEPECPADSLSAFPTVTPDLRGDMAQGSAPDGASSFQSLDSSLTET